MNKGGRPKTDVTRDKIIRVRVTETERNHLKFLASKCDMSLSDYIRDSASNKTIRFGLSSEELETIKDLARLSAGLGRISNIIKGTHGGEAVVSETKNLQREINNVIDKIYDR